MVYVAIPLAALLVYAAVRKLIGSPAVVATYERVGVPANRLPLLAIILLAGAAGVLVGLYVPFIGVAAAIGLTAYFALAIVAHLRHNDRANLPTPIIILALSIASLILRVAPV